jgi:cytochrome c-type biogenesis protein CcmH/NrfG
MKGPINPSSDGVDPQSLWRSGAQALREGRLDQALFAFESIIRLGRADATVWFAVALAKNRLGDDAGCWSALDQVLALDPKNVRALMMRADAYASRGEPVAASAFYGAVVRLGHASAPLEPDLLVELRRAERACAEHQEHYETHLRRPEGSRLPRSDVRQKADLLAGADAALLSGTAPD